MHSSRADLWWRGEELITPASRVLAYLEAVPPLRVPVSYQTPTPPAPPRPSFPLTLFFPASKGERTGW